MYLLKMEHWTRGGATCIISLLNSTSAGIHGFATLAPGAQSREVTTAGWLFALSLSSVIASPSILCIFIYIYIYTYTHTHLFLWYCSIPSLSFQGELCAALPELIKD